MEKNTQILIRLCLSFFLSFLFSFVINLFLIRLEKRKRVGQAIKEEMLLSHQKKKNTPTMGGVAIFISTWLTYLLFSFSYLKERKVQALFLGSILFFLIGFFDDRRKVKEKNGRGLSSLFRLFLETCIAVFLFFFLEYENKSMQYITIFFSKPLYLGLFFFFLFLFVIIGGANAVNLTDGLDGLAGGLTLMAFSPFFLFSLLEQEWGISFFLLCLIGSLIGFLLWNFHPAKIFMGDTGSLPLGFCFSLAPFLLHKEIYILLSGGLFIMETLSVILQVFVFQTRHHRLFKMAPFHHHLEMKGMKEAEVVLLFYFIGFLLSFMSTWLGVIL